MHAVSDIGAMVDWLQDQVDLGTESKDNLAVLHNRNDMVRGFGMSAWVIQSNQNVISWHDCLHGDSCPDQSWFSQWRKRTKIS